MITAAVEDTLTHLPLCGDSGATDVVIKFKLMDSGVVGKPRVGFETTAGKR